MKWKYYLRGLGIGMLVTALVLVLSGNTRAKMSDEAVRRRAAELGMVERDKTVLDDIGGTAADASSGVQPGDSVAGQPEEQTPADGTVEPEEEIKPQDETPEAGGDTPVQPEAADAAKEQGQEIEERADEVASRAEEVAENSPAGRAVTLEVRSGDSSVAVARRAAEAGLVQSAADFDVFLCRNGYDKRISVGSYEIIEGMSEKEIADIITRTR